MADELQTFCTQRQKKQLMFNPIVRLEIESPYNGLYTQEQLNMRRKAEILEYKRDDFKTKQNTQKEDFVEIVNGKQSDPYLQKIFYNLGETTIGKIILDTYVYLPIKEYNCEVDIITQTPSTNAGVPGNSIIIKDPSIPLYNYKQQRNYGIQEPLYNYNLYVQSDRNIFTNPGVNTEILNFYTVNAIGRSTEVTELSIPIAWYISGKLKSVAEFSGDNNFLSIRPPLNQVINISQINYSLKFNNDVIQNGTFSIPMSTDISFDISFVNISETNNEFVLQYYIGNITIDDIILNSTSDFVYDLEINPTISNVPFIYRENSGRLDITHGIVINPSMDLIETNVVLNTSDRITLQEIGAVGTSQEESIITSIRYVEDIGKQLNSYATFHQQSQETIIPLQKNLSSHIWMDVVYYNNERRIMFRNTTYQNGVYVVEDIDYDPNTTYYLQDGRYYIVNIKQEHPIAILETTGEILIYNSNNESLLTSYNIASTIYTSDTYTYNETQDIDGVSIEIAYHWNSIYLDVSGNFGQASIKCKNHGYMGGQNLLNYGVGNNTPQQDRIPLVIVPVKDEKDNNGDNTGEITAEYRQYQLSQQYNTFQWQS